jgi:hypothetical protein
MYLNIVVMDHIGLFVYLDLGYQRSFHDISILHQLFIHGNEYFKYLLVDLRYMGKEMFVMHCIERQRLTYSTNVDAIRHTMKCMQIIGSRWSAALEVSNTN